VAVPPVVVYQDEAGRLWDVLFLLRMAVCGSAGGPEDVNFFLDDLRSEADSDPNSSTLDQHAGGTQPE
jgi:hypothetical protein